MDTLEEVLAKLDSIKDSLVDYDIWKLIITNSDPELYQFLCFDKIDNIDDKELADHIREGQKGFNIVTKTRIYLIDTSEYFENPVMYSLKTLSSLLTLFDCINYDPGLFDPVFNAMVNDTNCHNRIFNTEVYYVTDTGEVYLILDIFTNKKAMIYPKDMS